MQRSQEDKVALENVVKEISKIPSSPKNYSATLGAKKLDNSGEQFEVDQRYSLQKFIYIAAHSEDTDIPETAREKADAFLKKFISAHLGVKRENIQDILSVDEFCFGGGCFINGITYSYSNPDTGDTDTVSFSMKDSKINFSRVNHGVYDKTVSVDAIVSCDREKFVGYVRSLQKVFPPKTLNS